MTWKKFNNHKWFHQDSNQLLLVFPGIGYHDEKPLLYYPIKQAINLGYDILVVNYPQYTFSITMIESYANQVVTQLDDVIAFAQHYQKQLVIAKSVGCLISKKLNIFPRKYILLTPTSEAITSLKEDDLVIMGDNDPLCRNYELIKVKNLTLFKGANHSLEVNDCLVSLQYLYQVMALIKPIMEE